MRNGNRPGNAADSGGRSPGFPREGDDDLAPLRRLSLLTLTMWWAAFC